MFALWSVFHRLPCSQALVSSVNVFASVLQINSLWIIPAVEESDMLPIDFDTFNYAHNWMAEGRRAKDGSAFCDFESRRHFAGWLFHEPPSSWTVLLLAEIIVSSLKKHDTECPY